MNIDTVMQALERDYFFADEEFSHYLSLTSNGLWHHSRYPRPTSQERSTADTINNQEVLTLLEKQKNKYGTYQGPVAEEEKDEESFRILYRVLKLSVRGYIEFGSFSDVYDGGDCETCGYNEDFYSHTFVHDIKEDMWRVDGKRNFGCYHAEVIDLTGQDAANYINAFQKVSENVDSLRDFFTTKLYMNSAFCD